MKSRSVFLHGGRRPHGPVRGLLGRWICALLLVASSLSTNALAHEEGDYTEAVLHFNQHDWEGARNLLEGFLHHYPKSHWRIPARLRLADLETHLGRTVELYQAVLNDEPQGEWATDAHWGLANTYYILGQYANALPHFVQVAEPPGPWQAPALVKAGVCQLALNQPEAARNLFQRVVKDFDATPWAEESLAGLGDAELRLRNFNAALQAYDRYLRAAPNGDQAPAVLWHKAVALEGQNLSEDAAVVLHELVTRFAASFEADQARRRLDDVQDNYTIQVGAFSQATYARKLEARLREKGYNAYILEARNGEEIFFQVRVGNYTTRAFAEKIAVQLEKQETLPHVIMPYIKPKLSR